MSVPLAISLAELKGPLEQAYRNTAYCSATLEQTNDTLGARYCGNRWCLVCNRIRTARAINQYLPVVDEWHGRHLVTLTIRNVAAAELAATLRGMVRTFQAVKLAMRRTDKIQLVALRKLECTYNEKRDDYHPHFHIVVKGAAAANALRARWLDHYASEAESAAQDVRECDSESLRELFKYFTKLLTRARGKTNELGKSRPVSPVALDVIFRSMKGVRVYQPVGFKIAQPTEPDAESEELEPVQGTAAPTRRGERVVWEWTQAVADWVAKDTGETLSGYEPGERFERFVRSIGARPPAETPTPRPLEVELPADWSEAAAVARMRERLLVYSRERRYDAVTLEVLDTVVELLPALVPVELEALEAPALAEQLEL